MKKPIIFAALTLLAACVQTVVETKEPFDPNAGTYVLANGSGTIEGQAFLRQQGGGVVTCAGTKVGLIPATAYQQERMTIVYGSSNGGSRLTGYGNVPPERDPRAEKLERSAVCDAEGDFTFNNVAAGDYYVTSTVSWVVSSATQGGHLAKRVNIKSGQTVRVLLN